MNIAVCEDNAEDRESICAYIKEYGERNCLDVTIFAFDSGELLLSALSREHFHIIFLDIYLTGISGIETARKIRSSNSDCVIVFITSSTDYALDGYEVSAVSYIVKPLEQKKMEKAFAMCQSAFAQGSRYIEIIADYQNIKVKVNNIMYVEVFGKAAVLHLNTGKTIKTYTPINKLGEILGCPPFLRCHRCFIVNLNFVEDMRERDFLMKNGDIVPIRKNGRAEVKLAMADFMCLG